MDKSRRSSRKVLALFRPPVPRVFEVQAWPAHGVRAHTLSILIENPWDSLAKQKKMDNPDTLSPEKERKMKGVLRNDNERIRTAAAEAIRFRGVPINHSGTLPYHGDTGCGGLG